MVAFSASVSLAQPSPFVGPVIAIEPAEDWDFTNEVEISFVTTGTEDPSNHSCCVQSIPGFGVVNITGPATLGIYPQEGTSIDWLPIEEVTVDENGVMSGGSFSEVAGYDNVETTFSGQFFNDGSGFEGSFTVGANGALPGGNPITFSIEAGYESSKILAGEDSLPTHNLDLSESVGSTIRSVAVGPEETLPFTLGLQSQGFTHEADWFAVLTVAGQTLSLNLENGQFEPGLFASYQGPLFDIPPTTLMEIPAEIIDQNPVVFFGVDSTPNGQLDIGTTTYIGVSYQSW